MNLIVKCFSDIVLSFMGKKFIMWDPS